MMQCKEPCTSFQAALQAARIHCCTASQCMQNKVQCIATGGRATCNHLPAKGSVPLKLNEEVGSSAPVLAAVDVGPAAVTALLLPFSALILPLLLAPAVALPLPLASGVAEAEPVVAMADAPPNMGVKAAAPAKGEEAKLFPKGAKGNVPAAGDPAASPDGLGSAAGASWGAPPLPAQQQLW